MAWTTPRTWTTGEIVTASHMNTDVRDNTGELKDTVQGDGGASLEHRHGYGAALPAAGHSGRGYVRNDSKGWYWEDGSDWRRAPQVLNTTATEVQKSNTAAWEILYTYTIRAGNIVAGAGVRLTLALGVVNNKGSAGTISYRLTFDDYVFTSNTVDLLDNAFGAESWAQFVIMVEDATNFEATGAHLVGRQIAGDYVFVEAATENMAIATLSSPGTGTPTVGTVVIKFESQMSAAHADMANQLRLAVLELIPAPTY